MNKMLMIAITLSWACVSGIGAETNAVPANKLFAKQEERLTQEILADINQIIPRLRGGTVSNAEGQKLRKRLELVARGDVLRGKTAVERQQIMIKLIGKSNYEEIRAYYTKECHSPSSVANKLLAIDILGCKLFSMESKDILLPLLLSPDPREQFSATVSLACLGEKGTFSLLRYMILSKLVKDPEAAYAVKALGVANDPDVGRFAILLCLSTNSGPLVVSESLPLMRNQPEYCQVVCKIIKSNQFSPSERKESGKTADELSLSNVLWALLDVIDNNIELLAKDEGVHKQVLDYAGSNKIDQHICIKALLILKDAGVGRKYFEDLLASEGLYKEKQDAIRKILVLIERESDAKKVGGTR